MRRRIAISLAVIPAMAGVSGTALAVTTVKTYTGCLVSKDGVIIKIKEGTAPTSPCTGGMVQVSFSGGDITSVTAGTGLTGGGDNGDVTISLATGFRLPQGCANGDIPKWNGTAWICGQDANTQYTAGTGLDLSGTEFSVEPGYRLPQSATTGDSLVRTSSGTWAPEQFTRANETCASGQFVRGTSSSGGLTCAAPPAGSSTTYVSASNDETGIPDDGANHTIAALNPGAGTYVLIATGTLTSVGNVDDFSAVGCELRADATIVQEFRFGSATTDNVVQIPFALSAGTPITNGFSLQCYADDGADGVGVENVRLVGIKLG